MEELEDPTESLKETVEAAEEQKEKWTLYVALSTAIIAVLAAIAGMLGNHHANDAMIDQIKSSDQWAYYQAKGLKAAIAEINPRLDSVKIIKYKTDQESIKKNAEVIEKRSEVYLDKHAVLSRAVTLFQIAIAISAIAILTRKRFLWYFGILLSLIGIFFFLMSFFSV